jgi:predicted ferric reductase
MHTIPLTHRYIVRGAFWVMVYLLLALAPLLIMLIGPVPEGRGFWRELSVALGFAGLAMMGLQFGITGRFRYITSPFGMDVIYHFHRQVSLVAFALVLAHPLILFVINPDTIRLLNLIEAPWRARFGVVSVLLLIILVVLSLWRLRLRLNYEAWRLSHGLLAVGVVMLAMLHVIGVGHYIDTPWKRAFWIVLTFVWVGVLFYVRVIKPIVMIRRPYVVDRVIPERGDAYTLVLRPDGHNGFRHKPGQFVWLTLWNTPFNITEHPFTISSSSEQNKAIDLTIKNLGDFSSTIGSVKPGQRAYLDGPYGAFTIDLHPADTYVFIAGGVGITPMMGMLRTMADRGDQRQAILLYGNPTLEAATFYDEIESLKDKLNLKVVHVLENPPEDWQGERGFITAEIIRRHVPGNLAEHEYFICGPNPMMDAIEQALADLGVPFEKYHSERFNFV